jgi:tetratricopeptide (TPR) repeat protein
MHPRQILTTGLAALVLAVLVLFLNPQLTPRAANGLLFTIVALMMAYRITYDNGKIRVVTRQTILVLVFSLLGGITAALVIIFVSSLWMPGSRAVFPAALVTGTGFAAYYFFRYGLTTLLIGLDLYHVALHYASLLVRLLPHLPEAYGMRGYIRAWLRDYPAALDDYMAAIERFEAQYPATKLQPTEAYVYFAYLTGRSVCYLELMKYEDAIVDSTAAVNLQPDSYHGYLNRAAAYIHTEQYDAAGADLEKAALVSSSSGDEILIFESRGLLNYALGDEETALADYKLALKAPLNIQDKRRLHPPIYGNMGCVYYRQGDFETTLTCFQKAQALAPEFMPVVSGLAITLYTLGERQEALRLWQSLVAREPKFSDADWVRQKYYRWTTPMADVARQIIADLQNGHSA